MATITGDDRANTLAGTGGADTIRARGGDDRLAGLGGADSLYGELGNDILDGGAGNDLLDGGAGRDIASYAGLTSRIVAEHNDYVSTGETGWVVTSVAGGQDTLAAVEGVVGTVHADDIRGGANTPDLIRGGAGDDLLEGGYYSNASDTIYGGPGNDRIAGGEEIGSRNGANADSADKFYGGAGNDRLSGLDGQDRLEGGDGDDLLSGGPDRDVLVGGGGRDTFVYLNADQGIGSGTTAGDFGRDLVADFRRGEDDLFFVADNASDSDPEAPDLRGFADLDSNRNGRLDDGDRHVEVETVSFGGQAKASTVVDVTGFLTWASSEQSLTVFGVTGLTATDFA
jgi:Ca2+-binding RTX toxin-like protein